MTVALSSTPSSFKSSYKRKLTPDIPTPNVSLTLPVIFPVQLLTVIFEVTVEILPL